MQQDDHLRLVAIFHFIGGAFTVCVAAFFSISIISVGAQVILANDGLLVSRLFVSVVYFLVAGLVVSPLVSALCIATRNFRWLSILASLPWLFFVPVGTLAGAYSLWVLTAQATKMLYQAHR